MKHKHTIAAINDGYELLQVFQSVTRKIHVDANKYMPYVDRIKKEIDLLKAWKKRDNRIYRMMEEYRAGGGEIS